MLIELELWHSCGTLHCLADHSEVPKFSAFGVPLDSELMGDEDGESGSDAGEIETESEVEE